MGVSIIQFRKTFMYCDFEENIWTGKTLSITCVAWEMCPSSQDIQTGRSRLGKRIITAHKVTELYIPSFIRSISHLCMPPTYSRHKKKKVPLARSLKCSSIPRSFKSISIPFLFLLSQIETKKKRISLISSLSSRCSPSSHLHFIMIFNPYSHPVTQSYPNISLSSHSITNCPTQTNPSIQIQPACWLANRYPFATKPERLACLPAILKGSRM